ncbi:GMC oxidoreductase [Trametes coccinea BRFM310]|uniref:GMC oxidoreductase n=1 Tax=Trametes coccinea (strain BRFM310) TaxID=1353009 RepID=A0A1Y2IVU0_TRAC3|nr:GMC oxidoreductase [Trametes coccinea BRFM310]
MSPLRSSATATFEMANAVGAQVPIDLSIDPEAYTYDFVIVGGGTAGCCLASRLSEDPAVKVLLIERGPLRDDWASKVPLISSNPYAKDAPVGRWWAQPLPQADGRPLEVVCGEALGGTSSINCMLYTRGTPGDYNRWSELGNNGWGYHDLEPYFVKSENTQSHPPSEWRGKHGPWLNQTHPHIPYRSMEYLIDALERAGIQHTDDTNSPHAPAASYAPPDVAQDSKNYRHSTFRAFLPPELCQERADRLKICTDTLVMRIEVVNGNGQAHARGVYFEATDYRLAGRRFYAQARREVVLCAGALVSPQILQLSGIGPRAHLEKVGIPVQCDLPGVGNHLQDHIAVPLTYEIPIEDSLHGLEANPFKAAKELLRYLLTGKGIFSLPFQPLAIYVPSRLLDSDGRLSVTSPQALDTSFPENRPDLEIMPNANNCTDHEITGKGIFTLIVGLIRPKSKGSVRLASSNPRARPDVDLGFLTNEDDYVPLRKGLKLSMNLAKDMRERGYPLQDLIVPGGTDDGSLDRFIRQNLRTCYHYTSTCRMGRKDDDDRPGVVDKELRVHGGFDESTVPTATIPCYIGLIGTRVRIIMSSFPEL